jgi:hypothetical protein
MVISLRSRTLASHGLLYRVQEVESPEERELLEAGGVVLEVIFDLDRGPGPWVWHLGVDQEVLPTADERLSQGEYLRGELTWRLIVIRNRGLAAVVRVVGVEPTRSSSPAF